MLMEQSRSEVFDAEDPCTSGAPRIDLVSEIQQETEYLLGKFLEPYNLLQGYAPPKSLRGEKTLTGAARAHNGDSVCVQGVLDTRSQEGMLVCGKKI